MPSREIVKILRHYKIVFVVKGSLTRDFRLQVFFMNQCPRGPQVFQWGRFKFFLKICGDIHK